MTEEGTTRATLWVMALALVVRIVWVAFAHVTPISDFAGYDSLAWNWLQTGHHAGATRTPGYPAVLALVYALFGHDLKAVGFLQALFAAANAGLLVVLARRFLPPPASIVAGLLYALSPTAIVYTPVLANETIALTFLLAGLLLLGVSPQEGAPRYGRGAAAGLLFGAMVLVRSAAAFFLPGLVLLAWYSPARRAWQVRRGALVTVLVVLVIAPWVVRNVRSGYGPKLTVAGGVTLWEGNNDRATLAGYTTPALPLEMSERDQDDFYERTAITWIKSHPKRYLLLSASRTWHMLGNDADTWAAKWLWPTPENDAASVAYFESVARGASPDPLLLRNGRKLSFLNKRMLRGMRLLVAPFLVAGLILWLCRFRFSAPLLLPVLSYLLAMSLTTGHPRYREMIDPLLFIPAAWLIVALISRRTTRGGPPEVWGGGQRCQAYLEPREERSTPV